MKLSKPDLTLALQLAQHLGFDMELMGELLPVGVSGMIKGINEYSGKEIINTA